jgi:hypothetical protein
MMSRVYSFSAYDKYMSLKLDSNMWLVIAYFLHPYILKISTIQMGRGGVKTDSVKGLKNLIYPDDFGFFLAFIASIPVLVLMLAYAKRKPDAAQWVRTIWRNGRNLLATAAVLSIIVVFVPFLTALSHSIPVYGWGQLVVAAGILYYLYSSKRVADTFADFPADSETESGKL